ncbi:MAG: hypothetical protein Q4F00_02965 [bacterium]|nr:hypothetical protein [bacterium]
MDLCTVTPIPVKSVKLPKTKIESSIIKKADDGLGQLGREFTELLNLLREPCDRRFIKMKSDPLWLDRQVAGLYPQWEKAGVSLRLGCGHYAAEVGAYTELACGGLRFEPVTAQEGMRTFCQGNGNPYLNEAGYLQIAGSTYKSYLFSGSFGGLKNDLKTESGRLLSFNNGNAQEAGRLAAVGQSVQFPLMAVCRLRGNNALPLSYPETIWELLCWKLIPEGLSAEQEDAFRRMLETPYAEDLKVFLPYLEEAKGGISLKIGALLANFRAGRIKRSVYGVRYDYQANTDAVLSGSDVKLIFDYYLNSDKRRADLTPYSEDQLTDRNKGHWELFEGLKQRDEAGYSAIQLEQPVFARPPQNDIIQNGEVAIDFGTKSTVVACARGTDERLLRVGKGNYAAAPVLEDFENPTVIELRDLQGFRRAYEAREGRPLTEWEQLTVSHQAYNDLKDIGGYSIFSELKQWANDRKRRLLLEDGQGRDLELKPYLELENGDFDPIEVYAYYLGLYINNMMHGIFLRYNLSFPVNYGKDVCGRLKASFERGLRKSLPPSILSDDKVMKYFFVDSLVSEPAAYAACALKELGLQPKESGQRVSYAIFDFGGGTTDFDFGVEEKPEDRRFGKFILHQFGASGDVNLGGENLLNLMAYEVYKDNLQVMRSMFIPFVLPPDAEPFAGAERLVYKTDQAPQEAYMNRRALAELMRPIWEKHEGYQNKFSKGNTSINLYSLGGEQQGPVSVKLVIKVDALEKLVERRIEVGVDNFFDMLFQVFGPKNYPDRLKQLPIHILLAGNSCKSPVVKKLFQRKIEAIEKNGQQRLLEERGQEANTKVMFALHLPLGMQEEAASDQQPGADQAKKETEAALAAEAERLAIELDRTCTGKTGVAFGLLRCRRSGKDVRIDDENRADGEAPFIWYLGNLDDEDKFNTVIPPNGGYGVWNKYDYANENCFYLYYTSEPRAAKPGVLPKRAVSCLFCSLDDDEVSDSPDTAIYIRKVDPNTIEYAVGRPEDFAKPEVQRKTHRQELK